MARTIYTEQVAGVELERAKVRAGTKCKCCGKELFGTIGIDFHQTRTSTCNVAFVCRECVKHQFYGSDLQGRAIIGGKLTSGNYRFAVELEALYKNSSSSAILETDCYLAAQWGLQPSEDCTVDVEYHMTNRVNFHGLKDFMQDVSNHVILDSESCGHHINISKIDWTAEDMARIRRYESDLFYNLLREMQADRTGTTELFGRYFTHYARADENYYHGSWLNLENTYHLEFRLPHFVNAKQFFYCANFCRDCVDILDKWLKGDYKTERASKKMAEQFKKYTEGKANCQRQERNKVER